MANNKTVKGKKTAVKKKKIIVQRVPPSLAEQAGAGSGGIIPPPEVRWKKGQSGNPNGRRKNAGTSLKEWLNIMGTWTRKQLMAVDRDPNAPAEKLTAARAWLDASSSDRAKNGMPIAGPDLDRIMDRTLGKPKQEVELTGKDGKALAIEHGGPKPEWDKLSTEELTLVEGILVKTIESEKQRNQLPAPNENGNGKAEE